MAKRPTAVGKAYNISCLQRHAKVNSELYNTLCGFRNVDDLHELDLSKNYVGNEAGFECIIELLKSAPQLKTVNLTCAGLTTQNVASLVQVFLKHPNIREIHLNMNRLYIDAGMQLVRLARFNPRIMSIHLVDQPANDVERQLANHIPPNIVAQMQRHLKFNREVAAKQQFGPGGGGGSSSSSWKDKLQAQNE